MAYVLEWRDADAVPAEPGESLVSHVRIFRSGAAVRLFVARRAFAAQAGSEFRLTVQRSGMPPTSVITARAAILAWDDQQTALPAALAVSHWGRDLERLAATAEVRGRLVAALVRAEAARLLSHQQTQLLHALLDQLLDA